MTWRSIWDKTYRWINIWFTQFRVVGLRNQRPKRDAQGIIIIKIDAIGDFLIWLDSAQQYKKLYSGQKITLVCNTFCVEIAKNTGFFDEVIPIETKKFEFNVKYKKEVWSRFRDRAFHTLLQTAYSRTVDMDLLARNIPAKEKIAFVADESRVNLSRYITLRHIRKKLDDSYDRLIPSGGKNLMELERNAVFIRGLGFDFQAGYPSLPQISVHQKVIPPKPYTIIFPGASSGKKMWPINRYAQVGEYIIREKEMDLYLCGGQNEEYLFYQFVEAMQHRELKNRVHNLFGKTTLSELAEIIRNAELLIGNDTSGIHFAAAVNTKGICIFGEFAYGRFLPYRCERDCKEHKPIVVCSAKKDCAGCAYGKITAACKENLLKTGRYQCVDEVLVDQVIRELS